MSPVSRRPRRRALPLLLSAGLVLPVLAGVPSAQAEEGSATETVVGELVQAWPEHANLQDAAAHAHEGPLSWVETSGGETVRVPTEDVEDIELGSTVEVVLGEEVVDTATAEDGLEPAREVLAAEVLDAPPAEEPALAEATTTVTNEVTVVMMIPGGGVQESGRTLTQVVNAVQTSVREFWSTQSNGAIEVGVTGQFDWFQGTATCADPYAIFAEAAAHAGWTEGPGRHLLVYLPRNSGGCSYGLAEVRTSPSSGGLLYVTDVATSLVAHELGHNFGLGHSSSLQCDGAVDTGSCRVRGYFDLYDVMGVSWEQVGSLNVRHAWTLTGRNDQMQEFAPNSPSATVTIAPVSQQSGLRAVRLVGGPGEEYWLEYRPASGRNDWLGTSQNRFGLQPGVLLRSVPATGEDASLLLDGTPSRTSEWSADLKAALPIGREMRIAGGDFFVTVLNVSASGAEIRIAGAANATPLVRTPESPAVYLLSATGKHPVADLATLTALSPLGPVRFVSQQYLDQWATKPRMGRVVASPSGITYFLDSAMKLPFSSCGQVAEYGGSCDAPVTLEQSRIDAFVSAPPITPLYRTTSGKAFYVTAGAKREVVDDDALTAAGLSTTGVRLLESGLGYLPYGVPITRDDVVILNRSTGAATVSVGGGFATVPQPLRAATVLGALPVRALDDASIRRLMSAAVSSPVVKEAGGSATFLLTETGKKHVSDPGMLPVSVPEVSAAFLSLFPDAGTFGGAGFLKGSTGSAVYVLDEGRRRSVGSWSALVRLAGDASPAILTVDQRLVDLLPAGPAQLPPGELVVAPSAATVYFVNGRDELLRVASFATTTDLGVTRLSPVADAAVAAYAVHGSGLSTAVTCEGTRYLGLGGRAYPIDDPAVADAYRLSYAVLDPGACAALPRGARALNRFLLGAEGTIYWIEDGAKRPIRSWETYVQMGGTSSSAISAGPAALSRIPTGSPL
ncbi:reprolysin-like metallopeptidase [Blastococcus saxobsidens]|uniref:Reprolysin-like metallo-peptidase family M12B n=1 Tax=Blastococcus saxobsidens (strain DD2) TaxID=1146883 RepID=H6RL21_BLASD|nr:hypothetical protein [Blastococcus saxobsidens]CCG04988.1 exported protein of unknown function [Blastococcus saxobsidens DD2]